jgi:hypothetical protein
MLRYLTRSSAVAAGVLVLLAAAAPLRPDDSLHRVWAVKDCRILVPGQPVVEKAVIVIRDGLIEAVGPNAAIPPDAEIIDGGKLTACPGFIDSLGTGFLKFPDEKFDAAKVLSGDYTDKDRGLTPEAEAVDFLNLTKSAIEKWNAAGFTAAQALSERGILIGRSTVFTLSVPDKTKSILVRAGGLGLGFTPAAVNAYPNSLMGVVALLRQTFGDAADYEMRQSRWRKEMKGLARPDDDPRLALLADFAAARKPVIFLCRNQYDIRRALALAADVKLDALIADLGGEAWQVLPELKAAKARVLCSVAFKAPGTSRPAQSGKDAREKAEKEIYPKNPARLAAAGIPFAFCSLGTDDPKSFSDGIAKAIEAGLSRSQAIEALTRTPAAFLGLDRALGTIEPGKIADFFLTAGEPLAKDAKIRFVFADGRRFELKEAKAKDGEKPTVNVSGRWELVIDGGTKVTVEFSQEEAALSGKMTTPYGIYDFSGGSVSGKDISFDMTMNAGGQSIDLYFSGSVEGETIRGSVAQGGQGSGEFTGKRIPGRMGGQR